LLIYKSFGKVVQFDKKQKMVNQTFTATKNITLDQPIYELRLPKPAGVLGVAGC
jgi:hypothetical protein